MDTERCNKLAAEEKLKRVIIPEFKAGKRFFVKRLVFGKCDYIRITDFHYSGSGEEAISIEEAKKLIAENPSLESEYIKSFFEFYE